jgi:hypothetical protein
MARKTSIQGNALKDATPAALGDTMSAAPGATIGKPGFKAMRLLTKVGKRGKKGPE